MMETGPQTERVGKILRDHTPVLIAYSGGVDSSVLLALGHHFLGQRVGAVIADSPSLPRQSLHQALEEARRMGVEPRILQTREMENPEYSANPPNRCYFCKAELFQQMERLARAEGFRALAYGENADDLAADRPGSRAAQEFSVLSPLRQAGLGKAAVRQLAAQFGLSSADAPAQPCLSSRIPHGTPVTTEALGMIEAGEEALRRLGFRILRVRHLQQKGACRARVQVAPAELDALRLLEVKVRELLLSIGYQDVEIDPDGYRGPSL